MDIILAFQIPPQGVGIIHKLIFGSSGNANTLVGHKFFYGNSSAIIEANAMNPAQNGWIIWDDPEIASTGGMPIIIPPGMRFKTRARNFTGSLVTVRHVLTLSIMPRVPREFAEYFHFEEEG
jgi:hypothetical protein